MDIAQSLDDEVQSSLVITHLPQQIYHFRNEIALLTYLVRLFSSTLALVRGNRTIQTFSGW